MVRANQSTQAQHRRPLALWIALAMALATACVVLPGCSRSDSARPDKKKSAAKKPEKPVEVPTSYSWQVQTKEAATPCALAVDGSGQPCATFRAEYPEFEDGPNKGMIKRLNDAVASLITTPSFDDHRAGSIDGTGRRFLQLYASTAKELPNYDRRWFDRRKVSVIFQDQRVLSLRLDEELYTGGVHELATTLLVSISLEQGERLSMADLFLEEHATKLNELGEKHLRELRKIPPGRSLAEAGLDFRGGRFRLSSNFAVVDQAVLFHYNPYEIGPFALGPSTLRLPVAELAELIRPEGPLGPPAAP